jgi:taurine--2-oxoglutarate transaminase
MPALLKNLRSRGVYAFGRYSIILVTPPLVITRDELAFGINGLASALDEIGPTL